MERITIGQITGAHGVKGEVRVFPLTDFPERFDGLKKVTLSKPMGKGNPEPLRDNVTVCGCKASGRFIIVSLDGVDSRAGAEQLQGLYIQVQRDEAHPLPEGSYYISDIVGMKVYLTTGSYLGEITDVLETGSNDVYVVNENDRQYLIPAIKDVVKAIDPKSKSMIVESLPGLLDLSE